MVGEGSRVEVQGTAAPRERGSSPGAIITFPGGHHLPRALGQRRGFPEPHPTEGPSCLLGRPLLRALRCAGKKRAGAALPGCAAPAAGGGSCEVAQPGTELTEGSCKALWG